MITEHFERLGARLAERWERHNFDAHAFPELALEEVDRAKTLIVVPASDMVPWLMSRPTLPYQQNIEASFGEPPVTLFWHSRFFIEALHWTTGTPEIHQHGFSGAFGVWEGSSVQSRFRFTADRRVNAALYFGRIDLEEVRVLEKGALEPIRGGADLIHSTFHLDMPSITLVVRTHTDRDKQPQLSYWRPGVAVDPFFKDPLTQRRLQMLVFLDRIHSTAFDGAATLALDNADLHSTIQILEVLRACEHGKDGYEHWLEQARQRHGDDILRAEAALAERERREIIRQRRAVVTSHQLRFFLALLLTLSSRAAIFTAVAQKFPGQSPRDLVMKWVLELSGVDLCGIEFDDVNRALFGFLLDGESVDGLLPKLAEQFDFDQTASEVDDIRQQCQLLKESAFFKNLLQAD